MAQAQQSKPLRIGKPMNMNMKDQARQEKKENRRQLQAIMYGQTMKPFLAESEFIAKTNGVINNYEK